MALTASVAVIIIIVLLFLVASQGFVQKFFTGELPEEQPEGAEDLSITGNLPLIFNANCFDYDSGVNIFKASYCIITNGTHNVTYKDFCKGGDILKKGGDVVEYFCEPLFSKSKCFSTRATCPEGTFCSNGACIKK